ncbi:heme/hemin ABC transporter substrate-binding protein [Buchananella hordeovulneris]|uniref:heme/hemin ABC transporter substrate-binding protein n=1 Tax=Buchananella hordeovulneris TaxID=52770 RepID=UPI0026DD37E9|nr:ABC transporter substrate-binding protein [Buchananella hordeovulneris]MDO5081244.1 ABC transporter substrate-binding protein [Buchananella hordeovulneris]
MRLKKLLIPAFALLVAACASGEPAAAPSATPSAVASTPAASQAPATDSAAPTQADTPAPVALPDPRTLTGLSEVPELADPLPIAGTFAQQLPVTLTDFEGNQVTVADTSRVLALDLSGTLSRTVIALGYGDKLVGRTVSSTETQLAELPVVTKDGHSLNAEAILSLQPTLILADRSVGPPEVIDQLRAAGVPVVLLDPERNLEATGPLITSVANALGVPDAGKALADRTQGEIDAALAQIKQWQPATPLEASFLYVRGTAGVFFILGQDEGATALITALGAQDAAARNGITSTTPANAEALVALNPEVILVMKSGLESTNGLPGLLERPGVAQTRAGATQRVVAIPDGVALSFGPQAGEVLLAVARALYGVPAGS